MNASYPGIRFPVRAELLGDFQSYRVFLDPWEPIAEELRQRWEPLSKRGQTSILAIYGPQGAGKTLLTKKLVEDFQISRLGHVTADENNIWHRVVGRDDKRLNADLIRTKTAKTVLEEIENKRTWVADATRILAGQADRACVLLADNAERGYFRQGLVEMTDVEFMSLTDSEGLNRLAAQRLVEHMREGLKGSMLVLLSNDDLFLLALQEQVDLQQKHLMEILPMRLPDAPTKETIIRVNTNRLNPVTYWSSIDQGTNDDREALKRALEGDSTFPDSFMAVDKASRNRTGRPAKRNVITLLALANSDRAADVGVQGFADAKRTEIDHDWMSVHLFEEGWTPSEMDSRERTLLESEWVLRIVTLGSPFIRSLLDAGDDPRPTDHWDAVSGLLAALKTFQGPGTKAPARAQYTSDLEAKLAAWPHSTRDLTLFWGAGQPRASTYEAALKKLMPGYDTKADGFLGVRPDFVVSPFKPCSVTAAVNDTNEAIRRAIRREAHVFEFTALAQPTAAGIRTYLKDKLPNYVQVTQEQ